MSSAIALQSFIISVLVGILLKRSDYSANISYTISLALCDVFVLHCVHTRFFFNYNDVDLFFSYYRVNSSSNGRPRGGLYICLCCNSALLISFKPLFCFQMERTNVVSEV